MSRKRKLRFEWQQNIVSLKGQAGTGGSGSPLSSIQNAVTARADAAEKICSVEACKFQKAILASCRSTDSQARSKWTARKGERC